MAQPRSTQRAAQKNAPNLDRLWNTLAGLLVMLTAGVCFAVAGLMAWPARLGAVPMPLSPLTLTPFLTALAVAFPTLPPEWTATPNPSATLTPTLASATATTATETPTASLTPLVTATDNVSTTSLIGNPALDVSATVESEATLTLGAPFPSPIGPTATGTDTPLPSRTPTASPTRTPTPRVYPGAPLRTYTPTITRTPSRTPQAYP
jgi:hypothetical protein